MAVGIISKAWRLGIGAAAAIAVAAAAHGAEPAAPFSLRAEGQFPLQYVETTTPKSSQHATSVAPYLGLTATAGLAPGLSASIFANGGHPQLGSFRDNDNTFASVGGNLVKHWGAALSTGVSLEHTNYYDGVFGKTSNIANDVNFFANYRNSFKPAALDFGLDSTRQILDPETAQSFDFGMKANLMDGKLALEVSSFLMDFDNLVSSTLKPGDALPTPNLASVDAVIKPEPTTPYHTFSPRNLQ